MMSSEELLAKYRKAGEQGYVEQQRAYAVQTLVLEVSNILDKMKNFENRIDRLERQYGKVDDNQYAADPESKSFPS